MAYETVLNVTPTLSSIGSYTYSSSTSGLSANILINISNTTLGSNYNDDICYLNIQTGAGTAFLTLSSASVLPTPQVWPGTVTSTFNTAASSATVNVVFPQRSLLTTQFNLSANATTIALDSTKQSTLDNFFYLTGSPDKTHQVRTTGGHSSLVAYLG